MNRRLLALIVIIIIIIIGVGVLLYSMQGYNQNTQNATYMNQSNNQTMMNNSSNMTGNIIYMQNGTFNPNNLTVKIGTNVQWINNDTKQHKIVSDNGIFQSNILNNGDSFSFTFAKAGIYGYHCGIHTSEVGTVTVQT